MEMLKEEKTITQISSDNGVHSSQLYKWKTQGVDKFHTLFENDNKTEKAHQVEQERKVNELYSEIGRLSTQLAWLKINLVSTMSRNQRIALIEQKHQDLSLTTQTELLGLNRTSLYYLPIPPTAKEVSTKHRIDELYTKYPFYGSRRITVVLGCPLIVKQYSGICANWVYQAFVLVQT